MKSKYVKKYENIVNKLVERSFPSLIGEKINICEKKAKWRGYADWPNRIITVSTKVRRYRREKVIGLLAHELCHFEINKMRGAFLYNIILLITKFSKKATFKIESEADMLAIQKGYGYYLLFSKKNQTARQKEGYLPRENVRILMKKFKEVRI